MIEFFTGLVGAITMMEPISAITALLMLFIGGLLSIIYWLSKDRKRLLDSLGKKDDKIEAIINKYHAGQTNVTDAMHSIKEVLIELRVLAGRG